MTTKRATKKSLMKATKKSSKLLKADDTSCLLNYLPSTYPIPIQTGSAQSPARAVLNTAALPPPGAQQVYCDLILMAVPVGPDDGDLFQQAPVASVNTGKWVVSRKRRMKGRELGLKDNDGDYATFVFECRDRSDYRINYNLVFGLAGAVTNVASRCEVVIMEHSGTTDDPSTFTEKKCSYFLTTSTPIFYLTNFVATAAAAPTVPTTEFPNGAAINLSWESNGTFFQVYQKDNPKPVWAGTQTSCSLKGGVKTDTTFVLVAMVSGDPGPDKPQSGYQPIYLFDALTVTVSNPDLTPKSLHVSDGATVGGALNVKGGVTLDNASVGGTLGVSGNSTLFGDLSVVGRLRLEENFSMNGSGIFEVDAPGVRGGRLRVDSEGQVSVGTSSSSGKLSVTGDADISGTLKVAGISGGLKVAGALSADTLSAGSLKLGADSLSKDGESFLFANGSTDKTNNVVLRKDAKFAYIFPWGTGTSFNMVSIGGGSKTNFSVSGVTELNGNVGIGVSQPKVPLHVGVTADKMKWDFQDQYTILAYRWNRDRGNDVILTLSEHNRSEFTNVSIVAQGNIAGLEFDAFSDERMKVIEGRSDGAADLRTLLSLEVTDYRHRDVVTKGNRPHKKFVAQQVEQVFPQAVGRTTEVVPDIYRPAPCADGWVELETDLKAGERVRLISEQGDGVYEVLEVRPDRFRTDIEPAGSRLFVYGREVDDFRTLDYDAVAALNVSATQQLKRETDAEVEALRGECAELKAANEALLKRLKNLESKVEAALSPAAYAAGSKFTG